MVAIAYETYLKEKTKGFRHSRRTFYQHLKGVHDLLRDWGNPEPVCIAGLFHSVYGTPSYRHKVVRSRKELQQLVGHEVENLVYAFCNTDRRYFTDPRLHEIEAANLVEQKSISPQARARLLDADISGMAKVALECRG